MLCDVCKAHEATIHVKEMRNGESHSINLCAACAEVKEKNGEFGMLGFNLSGMLGTLEKITGKANAPVRPESAGPTCPECGWTLEKIRHTGGRLGCPECYHAFGTMIEEAVRNVHRGSVHLGKRPPSSPHAASAALEAELAARRHELEALIRREEYEQAALCRDRINQLKAELESAAGAGDGNSPAAGDGNSPAAGDATGEGAHE